MKCEVTLVSFLTQISLIDSLFVPASVIRPIKGALMGQSHSSD